jgi:hypothetical protein
MVLVEGKHVRGVHVAPATQDYAWLFDLLFAGSPAVTWAPAGQLPAGYDRADQFAVLPGGGGRSFMVSLASRRGSSSALTSYNALRPARRRLARTGLGLALRSGLAQPLIATKIDIGLAADQPQQAATLLAAHLTGLLGGQPVVIAFGGGSGPYRKPVLQVFSAEGLPLGYVKIGWNAWTREAVRNEAAALSACASRPIALGVPAVLHYGSWQGLELMITAPLPEGVRRQGNALPPADVLREICGLSGTEVTELAASSWWADLQARIASGITDPATRVRLARVSDQLARRHGQLPLEFGRWHGDLVPWNLARLGARLYAWDWESSTASAPVGFDALHFCFQVAFVGQRRQLREAAALAASGARRALDALDVQARARDLLATLHLTELAVRHEEARSATGDADDRFAPAVIDLLERACTTRSGIAGLPAAGQVA